jgi:hypothetical protein
VARAAGTTLEAESAALSGGAVVQTDHAGYTGTGFVGGYIDSNKGNAATTFTVSSTYAGAGTGVLRYANGTGSARTLSVYVNGTKAAQISLAATANWDTWGTQTQGVTVRAGSNTIAYKFDTTDTGNVNLDNVTWTAPSAPAAGQFEAEAAALAGGAAVATDHTGYTGTGFVGGYIDANKGNASTTFTVSSSIAGNAPLTLRYSNGSGATQTVSLYVNGTKATQLTLPTTADWNTWTTVAQSVSLNAGSNTIAIKFDTTDTGNVNLDNIVMGATVAPPPPPTGALYEAESAFSSGGAASASSLSGASGGSYVAGFGGTGARTIFTVDSASAAASSVVLRYSATAASTVHVYVNGLVVHQVSLASTGSGSTWATANDSLTLRSGVNTVTYKVDSGDSAGGLAVDYVNLPNGPSLNTRGATLPYEEQEAENGTTNGTVLGPDRSFSTQASEASGRKAVKLSANGQYVQFTLAHAANSIDVRFSIPDTANGSNYSPTLGLYVNGTRSQSLTLTNRYSWEYGAYPYNNDPTTATSTLPARHFWDEVHVSTAGLPAGTVVKLQKDSGDTASYYAIDLVDFEQVDAAYPMPTGYLTITSYGATANDGTDDTTAIQNAVNAAESQGKGLWIPAGQFEISNHVNLVGVTVRGAGPWYSILHGASSCLGGLFATGSNVQVFDLAILGGNVLRNDGTCQAGLEGNFGTGSMVQNVWIEHTKVGMWPDTGTNGLYVGEVRIRGTFADGINIHGGAQNVLFTQSNVRGTGDDAMAMDSENGTDAYDSLTYDTAQAPWLASNAAVYGGGNMRIENNLLTDTVTSGGGVNVSTAFGNPFNGPVWVQHNTLLRTGSHEQNLNSNYGGVWIFAKNSNITTPVTVNDNLIQDSTYSGIVLDYNMTISGIVFSNDQIVTTGLYGIEIISAGSGTFSNVTVTGAPSGGLSLTGGFVITRGSGNSGW